MGKSLEKAALDESNEKQTQESVTRNKAAIALRIAGASFQQIADIEGFSSPTKARRAVEAGLAATVDEGKDVTHQRALASARLDRLLSSVFNKAVDTKNPDQIAYNRAALAIIDRQAKLHGLDAPQKHEIYTPDQAERQAWIDKVLTELGEDAEGEEDIIDAEVVE